MKNNWALFAKPGVQLNAAHIKADLKGKTIFSYGDTWTEAMIPFVLKYAGLSSSQVKILTAPSGNDVTDLLAGRVAVATNTTNYETPSYAGTKTKGKETVLLGTAVGAPNIPIWVYAVTKHYASAHSATLKAFMSAMEKATKWAAANQVKAASEFGKAYPTSGYTNAYSLLGWKLTVPFLVNSRGQYFTQTNAEWKTLASALKAIKLIKAGAKPSAYYTNKFLPGS